MTGRPLPLMALAAALVLGVNVIVLGGAAWNRGAEEARLQMGERELSLSGDWQGNDENSGLALALRWRVAPLTDPEDGQYLSEHSYHAATTWLDADRLAMLGFVLPDPVAGEPPRRWRLQSREAWLALEFDGPAHQRSVARAEHWLAAAEARLAEHPDAREHRDRVDSAKRHVAAVREQWSRLLVIDSDADAQTLRQRHPDRQRVAVVRGRIGASWVAEGPTSRGKGAWRGHIDAVSVDQIHVPLDLPAPLDALPEQRYDERQDRYAVELAWGRRHEPWIISVSSRTP
jgi:hypothetical protein